MYLLFVHNSIAVAGNLPIFLGVDDKDTNSGVRSCDIAILWGGVVELFVDLDAEVAESRTNSTADDRVVFADTASESEDVDAFK